MTDSIVLLQAGQSPRLSRLLDFALAEFAVEPAGLPELEAMALQGRRVLIALTTGEGGMSLEAFRLLQSLRTHPDCLRGATGALIVDGAGELYTKQAAQAVALAANLPAASSPSSPVEGTGSLYNQHILAGQLGLPWEETYFTRARDLAGTAGPGSRLPGSPGPGFSCSMPQTTAFQHRGYGEGRLQPPGPVCDIQTISLQNGAIYDCPGLLLHCVPPLLPQWHLLLRRGPAHGSLPRHFTKRRGALAVSQLQRLSQRQHPGPHQPNDRSAPAAAPI